MTRVKSLKCLAGESNTWDMGKRRKRQILLLSSVTHGSAKLQSGAFETNKKIFPLHTLRN